MLRIFDFLFPPRVDEVTLRGVSTDDFLALVVPRLIVETRPETVGLLPFSHASVRSAIHEAKYHGSEHAFNLLGAALGEYLADIDEGFTKSFIVVPVPLGRERRKERGFNQVEEIAKRAAKLLGGASVDTALLVRTRETASQVSLPREARGENMRGAFRTMRPADPVCTYIVLDDVITTGATLGAAIASLKEAGATHIVPLALAH
ncbi:MAG: hypothetical protein WC217_00635 [Candidatus Paceibacterota bacterium]|jgi:ComF family protein